MLTEYIRRAMAKAKYEILEDGEGFFGSIPGFRGLWANEPTLEKCRDDLQSALEGWILLGVSQGEELPEIDGFRLEYGAQLKRTA